MAAPDTPPLPEMPTFQPVMTSTQKPAQDSASSTALVDDNADMVVPMVVEEVRANVDAEKQVEKLETADVVVKKDRDTPVAVASTSNVVECSSNIVASTSDVVQPRKRKVPASYNEVVPTLIQHVPSDSEVVPSKRKSVPSTTRVLTPASDDVVPDDKSSIEVGEQPPPQKSNNNTAFMTLRIYNLC